MPKFMFETTFLEESYARGFVNIISHYKFINNNDINISESDNGRVWFVSVDVGSIVDLEALKRKAREYKIMLRGEQE